MFSHIFGYAKIGVNMEICSTFTIKGVNQEAIHLCLFPFSLLGKAKQWFYSNCFTLIMMVQASPFCGKAHEGANAHLQHFLEICSTFTIKGVSQEAIRLRLLTFSLLGKAKQWFYSNHNVVDT